MNQDFTGNPQNSAQAMAETGKRNLKVLAVVLVLFGIAYYLMSNFLPYHDDPLIVRHAAAKMGLVTCERQVNTAHPGIGDAALPLCECASQNFADHLTAAEIKPLQTHKEQFAPPFEMTPAFQAHLDKEIAACPAPAAAR